MIELGLSRITALLKQTPQSWKAIHVAGTNGKGSICAYLSAMLHATGASCGRFTSPHLIDRWDCISLDEAPVSESLFRKVERLVQQRNQQERIAATPFELLTATAFEIFQRRGVDFGVVEVGVGGALDATNVLRQKTVTVVSKIGLDHQGLLSDTVEQIALHKAGIMMPGVPCVVDASNSPSVLRVIADHAARVGAEVVHASTSDAELNELSRVFERHQLQNFACARTAFRLARPEADSSLARLLPIIRDVAWPGRLQVLDIGQLVGHEQPALLDGAHNPQSATALAAYVEKHLRPQGRPVIWVIAASDGKDLRAMLSSLLRTEDEVYAVTFGSVDGMPWVKPAAPRDILQAAAACGIDAQRLYGGERDLQDCLVRAASTASSSNGAVVIAGSLYLVSDVLRLLRDGKPHSNKP